MELSIGVLVVFFMLWDSEAGLFLGYHESVGEGNKVWKSRD